MPKSTPHPSHEKLNAFSLGQLPPQEAAVVEGHIHDCEPCCETMLGLSSDDTFVGLLQEVQQLADDLTIDQSGASSSSASMTDDVPALLAEHPRYEIVGLIGKGGMGAVYEARHRMMDRTVALKIINRELVRKPEAVDRFHREVKAAAQLAHPNIVTAHDAEQVGNVHFLVMEYVDGVDLSHAVRDRGALPVSEACDYVRQAAIGLQHAHEQGMVHRDIKPHNLMLTADSTVKILDFGLASLAPKAATQVGIPAVRSDLTAVGDVMGTPDFISPEQADDARQADIRSDIYSLGATLYYLLSGRPPFTDGGVLQKLKSHAESEPESLVSLRDDIPEGLVAVVAKMMAKDPNQRFQTPTAVAEALDSLNPFPQVLPPVKKQATKKQVRHHQQRRRMLPRATASSLALLAAVIATGLYFLFTGDGGVQSLFRKEVRPLMVGGGTIVENERWKFSSGSLYLQRNEPGVLFGIHENPAGVGELSFVMLFRHDLSDAINVTRPSNTITFDGKVATISEGIMINGKGIKLELEIQLNEQKSGIKSTKLSIDGKDVEYAKGRLFLVDFTNEKVSWKQAKLTIPGDLPKLKDIENDTSKVMKLAKQLMPQMQENDEKRVDFQLKVLKQALDLYKLNNGNYPSTEEGLEALVKQPVTKNSAQKWGGPYLKELPVDPWGNAFCYRFPAEVGEYATKPLVWSRGADHVDN